MSIKYDTSRFSDMTTDKVCPRKIVGQWGQTVILAHIVEVFFEITTRYLLKLGEYLTNQKWLDDDWFEYLVLPSASKDTKKLYLHFSKVCFQSL